MMGTVSWCRRTCIGRSVGRWMESAYVGRTNGSRPTQPLLITTALREGGLSITLPMAPCPSRRARALRTPHCAPHRVWGCCTWPTRPPQRVGVWDMTTHTSSPAVIWNQDSGTSPRTTHQSSLTTPNYHSSFPPVRLRRHRFCLLRGHDECRGRLWFHSRI